MRKTGVTLTICHNRLVAFLVTMGLLWLSCTLAPIPALADNAVSDLPTSHWAIGSLRTLTRVGLIDSRLLPGNEAVSVTRLEIALAVSQALGNLRASAPSSQQAADELDLSRLIAIYNSSRPRGRNLGSKEIEALRALVVEFGPELDILGITVLSTQDLGGAQDASVAASFVDLDTLMGSPSQSGTTGTVDNAKPPAVTAPGNGSAADKLTPTQPSPGNETLHGEGRPDGSGGQARPDNASGPVTPTDTAVTLSPGAGAGSAQPGADLAAFPSLAAEPSKGLFSGASSVGEQVTLDSALARKGVIAVDTEMNTKASRVNALKRVFIVEPSLKVSSEFLANPKAAPETGAVSVEAAVKVGEVKLGASLRNVSGLDSPSINPLDAQGKTGYDVTLKLGNVTLLTGYEKLTTASETQNLRLIGVNYSFSDLATLRAGYQFVDIDSVTPKAKAANTVVGVDFNLSNSATLKADFQLQGPREWSSLFSGSEGQKASAGVEVRLPWNAKVTAGYELYRQSSAGTPQPLQQTASVGLGYNFMQNATLLLGYRLIDFGNGEDAKDPQSDLTAGVSLRF